MKISITLSMDALMACNAQLKHIWDMPVSTDKRENVYKSIGMELADKFDKKCKAQLKKHGLFDQKKKFKVDLKFHEAWALQEILSDLLPGVNNSYHNMHLQSIIHRLDQKTC